MKLLGKLSAQGGEHILGAPCHHLISTAYTAKSSQLFNKVAVCVPVNYTVGHQSAVSSSCQDYKMAAHRTDQL